MKASLFKILMAAMLLVQGCSSNTSGDGELAAVLDEAADREGVPTGECRDACVVEALAVFDACTDEGGDREACFGRAIHSFFECVRECPPPTCEEACEAKATQHQMQCLDEGGTVDGCNREAREILAQCQEDACTDPEPPTCKDRCESHAEDVYDRCLEAGPIGPTPKSGAGDEDGAGGNGGEEKRCALVAREAREDCIAENCVDPEPPTCEDRCEGAATKMYEECVADSGDEDRCAMAARDKLAICIADHCEEPPSCGDKCGAIAEHVYDACMSKLDSEEQCAKIARGAQKLCNKHCDGYECPCHDDDCDDEDSDSDSDSHGGSDSHGHGDSDSHGGSDSDSGKHCDPDGPTPKKGGHCK